VACLDGARLETIELPKSEPTSVVEEENRLAEKAAL
jgi:hypothetical protein